ncbi:hypothetical protein [Caproiciproducens faecalis]|uniref:Uncharacterized protein n=1 Tax=Caproiciproducens faecalis TaxID=2820301 RepID=A0ABS7DPB6_9FIRM|nr:hypothetical protein [Caproiciproducens faecalis]MBW7573161.1 hypothetical protein [Caproiciproducens faecalis]
MMIQEFESRTGFYPSQDLYSFIEAAYMESNLDKDAFCNAYKQNENGMADAIARKASIAKITASDKAEKENVEKISGLEKEVERLKAQLDREQEWKLYDGDRNVKQDDYERLASSVPNTAYYMTDEEAKDWICSEFDFDRDKITILHEIDEYEINRHRQVRKTGRKIDRRPVYCATDYHYIRFNTSHWYYEVWNDTLCPFYD